MTHRIFYNNKWFQIPDRLSSRRYTQSTGTGENWDEAAPDVDQPHGLDYREHQDLRLGVRKRLEHEHSDFADLTLGGYHLSGSAVAFYDSTDPTTRPNGSAMTSDDNGRIWIDSSSGNIHYYENTAGNSWRPVTPYFNVKHYGALGDNSNDDTTSIQAAINAMEAAGGGVVYFPYGIYIVSGLNVTNACDFLGYNATLKLKTATNDTPILSIRVTGVSVYGLKFDGNKAGQAGAFSDSFAGRDQNAAISMDANTYAGINNLIVKDCNFVDQYGACIVTQDVSKVIVTDCIADGNNFEFYIGYATAATALTDIKISDNRILNCASSDATVNSNGIVVTNADRVSITNNLFYNCERNFVKIQCDGRDVTDINISGNLGTTNTIDNFAAVQVQVTSQTANNVNITGNTFRDVGCGIQLSAGTLACGNISDNTVLTTDGSSTGDGIQLIGTVNQSKISGNTLKTIARDGIRFTGGGTGIQISDNFLYGNAANLGIYIISTASNSNITHLQIKNNYITNFAAGAGTGGILALVNNAATTLGFDEVEISGNMLMAGGSANRALYITESDLLDTAGNAFGIIRNNIIDGKVEMYDEHFIFEGNRPTGTIIGRVQTLTGAGAASVVKKITHFVTSGVGDAVTLADGKEGDEKTLYLKTLSAGGHTTVVTPANFGDGTNMTFNASGDYVLLRFINGKWWVSYNRSVTVA